ncbi:MAG: RNA polymerase sigma-54 factor [Desulfobacterales bacterium]|nr:MAG: RNA polymerase sigma-54 factor [Desulfobacterales bacterium]
MELLQLNHLELATALQEELKENPALEENFSVLKKENLSSLSATREDSGTQQEHDFTEKISASESILPETNWEDYTNTFDSNLSFSKEKPPADAPSQFDFISEQPGLAAYLGWQLSHEELDEKEMEIAQFIIGNLNRYGFLEVDLEQIISATGCDRDEAEYVLCDVIQLLDPPGIAARDISESLFLQLERMGREKELAAEIVRDHLELVAARNYRQLAKDTGSKISEVEKAISFIREKLVPYPGLPYSNEQTQYIAPDVYVREIDNEFVVQLNDEELPDLKLSDEIRQMLDSTETDKQSRQYLADKMKNADWFIKSLHQRQQTIYRVMVSILKFQRNFFEKGPEHLRPLILKDVADDIGVHESTVSRTTSNKYVHTPQGIYELKYFFSTAIQKEDGTSLAAESIKTIIKRLVNDEDKKRPLSDSAIAAKLEEKDIKIARRTVAKYREQMDILPTKLRRKK